MLKFNLILLLSTLLTLSTFAKIGAPQIDKNQAKVILNKTARALGVAHMTVKRTKNYSGNLSKAVRHAQYARTLYQAGEFDKSAYHSLYARKIGAEVMKENNAKTNSDYLFSASENTLISSSPSDEALSKEAAEKNTTELSDESLMKGYLDIMAQ